MAELAGLVVGGVALASTFSTCVESFSYIQDARNLGSDYEKSMLKLDLVKLRLTRWGESTHITIDVGESHRAIAPVASDEAQKVNDLLGQVMATIEDTERVSKRFNKVPQPPTSRAVVQSSAEEATMLSVRQKVRDIARRRQKRTSIVQKTAWALYERKHLDRLIEDVSGFVTDLVDLFPGPADATQELCRREVADVAEVSNTSGVNILAEATSKVDKDLNDIARMTLQEKLTGHVYEGKYLADANGQQRFGDEYGSSTSADLVAGKRHYFGGSATASNHGKQQFGNSYGGKSFFNS